MVGLMLMALIVILVVIAGPVAIIFGGANREGRVILFNVVGVFFPVCIAIVAIPVTLVMRCLTAFYLIPDLSWSWVILGGVMFGTFALIWRKLAVLLTYGVVSAEGNSQLPAK